MFDTAFALSLTQFARTLSFPERVQHRAARNGVLEAWRMRSASLDACFYDIKVLTAEEIYYISDAIAAEGLIMIVPPTGDAMLTVCDSIDEYKLRGGRHVHAMAVAGVGGSAVGAAAFARNVADALGEPVAAVVSGYGLGDMMFEAMGGSMLFGWLGSLRNECEIIDDVVGRPQLGAYDERHKPVAKMRPTSLDADTVESLLADEDLSFRLLVGHSKGNLVLSQALYGLKAEKPARLRAIASGARIVTFGARITMPPDFKVVTDVMGALDWYGEMNSRPMIESDLNVPMAGHSTNTDMPGALDVKSIIKDILAANPSAPVAGDETLPVVKEPKLRSVASPPTDVIEMPAEAAPTPHAENEAEHASRADATAQRSAPVISEETTPPPAAAKPSAAKPAKSPAPRRAQPRGGKGTGRR